MTVQGPVKKQQPDGMSHRGGGAGIAAQLLHVTNQGQSVQKRIKEGMKGRSVGLVCEPPPCACGNKL